ncbi:antirepressor, BRO family protein [Campylobacter coli]|uniref:BRO-N domain-containing protein n=1 Tax=Campylobacter coli TaxID=195 RepID=UPI00107C6C6B|nr:BRO family protein [Campylobacter coli]EAC1595270.1 antirepressor, BRO family protein [Campylobacter coli]EAC1929420.1 antirepressor, BRO family protein [Campylobacter coli]EAH4595761.1 antirepressor, BRO family protein [Campylobacter coli]EAH5012289.1 antirepressor, BRO family protein [Campylobacter coli]EAH5015249.1 antirepressor, BRO family protein [Campylobacter coli]
MSKVILFENEELGQVRTIRDKNNEPLFCLNDICKILNIKKTNSVRDSINKEFDKGGVFEWHPFKTLGGIQKFIVINEPELYFVLMRSDKPKAKPFRQWVIKEVLPSIRKQGYYASNNTPKLENYNKYKIPNTPYKENIIKAIMQTEQNRNCEFEELIAYEIKEIYKDNKSHIEQKINFKVKGLI